MNKFDRIYELLSIFRSRRYPVSRRVLAEELECSVPTVKRLIAKLRHELGAPIHYDARLNGYYLDAQDETSHELPGLWFTLSELQSLLMIHELLGHLEPGIIKEEFGAFQARIESILQANNIVTNEMGQRFLLLGFGKRPCSPVYFKLVVTAVLERRRLALQYHGRQNDRVTDRTVSPQRILYYRDNWYLDCWCHAGNGFRTFALERIVNARLLEQVAEEFPQETLDDLHASTFGIISGPARQTAILRFTPQRARWVADEQWHPNQRGEWLPDGSYELFLPYSDSRELLLDILRYGPDVEVIGPDELRGQVRESLEAALRVYQE